MNAAAVVALTVTAFVLAAELLTILRGLRRAYEAETRAHDEACSIDDFTAWRSALRDVTGARP